jgi:hypothetical protein
MVHLARPVLLAGLASCGPSLVQDPKEFVGDETAKIGTLCSGAEISTGNDDYWVKFLTVHDGAWTAEWERGELKVSGAEVRRRAAGNPTKQADGTIRRYETYWFEVTPGTPPGTTVTLGPLSYRLKGPGLAARRLESATCTATVK